MDELVVAEIDADVREREAPGVEEHEVARLQFGQLDYLADVAHVLRGARQRDARHLLEHVADEPAAIESGFRRVAAPFVTNADEAERGGGKILRRPERGRRRTLDRGRRGLRERTGVGVLRQRDRRGHRHQRHEHRRDAMAMKRCRVGRARTGRGRRHGGIVREYVPAGKFCRRARSS